MTLTPESTLHFSRVIAVLLLVTYIVYLYFQLVSHNKYFLPPVDPEGEAEEEEEGAEAPALTVTAEIGVLLAISLVVAVASECAPQLSSSCPPADVTMHC